MKKNYQFRYGNTTVTLPIEENQVIGVIEGNETPVLDDIEGELYKVLDNPVESAPLSEVASKASSI